MARAMERARKRSGAPSTPRGRRPRRRACSCGRPVRAPCLGWMAACFGWCASAPCLNRALRSRLPAERLEAAQEGPEGRQAGRHGGGSFKESRDARGARRPECSAGRDREQRAGPARRRSLRPCNRPACAPWGTERPGEVGPGTNAHGGLTGLLGAGTKRVVAAGPSGRENRAAVRPGLIQGLAPQGRQARDASLLPARRRPRPFPRSWGEGPPALPPKQPRTVRPAVVLGARPPGAKAGAPCA